jgi:hypothetical protein
MKILKETTKNERNLMNGKLYILLQVSKGYMNRKENL